MTSQTLTSTASTTHIVKNIAHATGTAATSTKGTTIKETRTSTLV